MSRVLVHLRGALHERDNVGRTLAYRADGGRTLTVNARECLVTVSATGVCVSRRGTSDKVSFYPAWRVLAVEDPDGVVEFR